MTLNQMNDRTIFTFDLPDERQITVDRLLPMLHRDDSVKLDDESHVVQSSSLVVDSKTGDVTLYVHLRLGAS